MLTPPRRRRPAADHYASASRLKTFTWHLRDERPRLLGWAVRNLDADNNVEVSGSVTVVGKGNNLQQGLGWVNHPKGRALVKKVTYNLTSGTTDLELSREEFRIGELPPTDRERMNVVEARVMKLTRSMELQQGLDTKHKSGKTEGSSILVIR